jgi:hypothetical protein
MRHLSTLFGVVAVVCLVIGSLISTSIIKAQTTTGLLAATDPCCACTFQCAVNDGKATGCPGIGCGGNGCPNNCDCTWGPNTKRCYCN